MSETAVALDPALFDSARVEPLYHHYHQTPAPSVTVPRALPAPAAAALRAQVEEAGLAPFFVADQGRYLRGEPPLDHPLFESLRALCSRIAGRPLAVGGASVARLGRGDYSLLKGSEASRPFVESFAEATLDFSESPTGEAEIVYTDGGARWFALPQEPGSLALVERPPGLYRYERYLGLRVGESRVYRLRLALRPAAREADRPT